MTDYERISRVIIEEVCKERHSIEEIVEMFAFISALSTVCTTIAETIAKELKSNEQ